MHSATAGALTLLLCGAALGQTKLEFEVATVKPAAPGPTIIGRQGGPGSRDPGRVNYTAMALKNLLSFAYGVKIFQISGPSWMASERYDITATIPEGTTKEQFPVMLQNLLLDRFKIKLHHETKEFPFYELSVAKNGPKLKASVADANVNPNDPPPLPGPLPKSKDGFPQLPPGRKGLFIMLRPNGFHLAAMVQSMSEFSDVLAEQLGGAVVDKTGLSGTFEFTLDFAPEPDFFQRNGLNPPPPPPGGNGPAAGPTPGPTAAGDPAETPNILTAVQDQLGLKLEKKKGPLDVIVIDQVEKTPTEN
jgi:uncharacterized protein (TIGR03435 family)